MAEQRNTSTNLGAISTDFVTQARVSPATKPMHDAPQERSDGIPVTVNEPLSVPEQSVMPQTPRKLIVLVAIAGLVLAGVAVALWVSNQQAREQNQQRIQTQLNQAQERTQDLQQQQSRVQQAIAAGRNTQSSSPATSEVTPSGAMANRDFKAGATGLPYDGAGAVELKLAQSLSIKN